MSLLDFIFPKRCVGCGTFGAYFCPKCRSRLRPVASNEPICSMCERPAIDGVTHPRCRTKYDIDGLTSFFHYNGPVRAAVKALKYRYVSDLAAEFISLVPEELLSFCHPREGGDPDDIKQIPDRARLAGVPAKRVGNDRIIVPIPLHASRLRARGFNQAEKLAQKLSDRLAVPLGLRMPVRTDILVRTRATVPQVAMKHRKDRLKNMHGVFAVRSETALILKGRNILLVDDVFTTGATMREAANVLKRAGIDKVWVVTMAR